MNEWRLVNEAIEMHVCKLSMGLKKQAIPATQQWAPTPRDIQAPVTLW